MGPRTFHHSGQLPLNGTEPARPEAPSDVSHAERIEEKLLFATDEQLAGWLAPPEARIARVEQKLQTIANFIADLKARVPGMERELAEAECELAAAKQNVQKVREQLEPRSKSTDGLRPPAAA